MDQVVAVSLRIVPSKGELHNKMMENEVVQDNVSWLLHSGAKDELVKNVVPDMVQDRMIEIGH